MGRLALGPLGISSSRIDKNSPGTGTVAYGVLGTDAHNPQDAARPTEEGIRTHPLS